MSQQNNQPTNQPITNQPTNPPAQQTHNQPTEVTWAKVVFQVVRSVERLAIIWGVGWFLTELPEPLMEKLITPISGFLLALASFYLGHRAGERNKDD